MKLRIGVKHGKSLAPQLSAERLVNMYAEGADGKSSSVLHGGPGLSTFATCGTGPVRGKLEHLEVMYVVSGNTLYSVASDGTATSRGTIAGSGRVGMASNGTYLCIVTGVGNPGYLYSPTTLQTITDTDFLGSDTVASLQGYFIFSDGDTFYINTTAYNGVNYDALDFASAEGKPDKIVAPFADRLELLLFGKLTTEGWSNTGNADFPFELTPGAIAEKGLASPWAVAQLDNTVFWLDQNGIARRAGDGYTTQAISTPNEVEAFGTLSTAEAFAFIHRGHEFFVLRFDNGTWIYDATTGLWHERASWDKDTWRVSTHCWVYGDNYVGDAENGNIYKIDQDIHQEAGGLMVSEIIFPPINKDGKKFRLSSLQLDLEQGSAGDVRLWLSNDGETWRSAGTRSLGAVGDREARTIWRNLGQHRNLHLKFAISDNVRRAVFSAFATIK